MEITNLKLVNYRNYNQININFSKNINIIYGNNGTGKSNLIEAIYLLSLTKSFRTLDDKNLIKKGNNTALVKGIIDNIVYFIELSTTMKKTFINNKKINKIGDYISKVNIVLFNPLDTKILTDSPSVRRKMLNIEISQINKDYINLLSNYNRVLKHRNAYLKQLFLNGNSSLDYLNILTTKLIDLGIELYNIRSNYIEQINNNLTDIYKKIFDYGELKIKYITNFNKNKDDILKLFQKNYKKEISYGKTIFGVHHDDIEFVLDDYNIKEYGSVGQQKNSIISFKLAELPIIKKINGTYPILILDDLFSELDNKKINNIINMLNNEVQTFITTTDIDKVDKNLLKDSYIYCTNNEKIERID
ncbi:MAG: DNA replication/repair protein RecF [bacterium]|nr:DNA replication/repair protein RecF [bacterium]